MKKIIACLFFMVFIGCVDQDVATYELPLVSLDRTNEIYGSFVFGYGTIQNISYYYVFTEEPDGSFQERHFATFMTKIFETEEKPKLKFINAIKRTQNGINRYGIPFHKRDVGCIELYIPKNSIVRNYDPNFN